MKWYRVVMLFILLVLVAACTVSCSSATVNKTADQLLNSKWGQHQDTLFDDIMYVTGHPNYVGSGNFPDLDIRVTPVNDGTGAYNVTLTLPVATPNSGLELEGSAGIATLTYWVSEDGEHMRTTNENATYVDWYGP